MMNTEPGALEYLVRHFASRLPADGRFRTASPAALSRQQEFLDSQEKPGP